MTLNPQSQWIANSRAQLVVTSIKGEKRGELGDGFDGLKGKWITMSLVTVIPD
ncbi:MAG: hypothetical protein U0936_24735 [Planctomycetaceae bacterium]